MIQYNLIDNANDEGTKLNETDDNVAAFRLIKGGANEMTVNQLVGLVTNMVLVRYVGGRALRKVAAEFGHEMDARTARRIVMSLRVVVRLTMPPRGPRPEQPVDKSMTVREALDKGNEWIAVNTPIALEWLESKRRR